MPCSTWNPTKREPLRLGGEAVAPTPRSLPIKSINSQRTLRVVRERLRVLGKVPGKESKNSMLRKPLQKLLCKQVKQQ